jgi:hypothetical protein
MELPIDADKLTIIVIGEVLDRDNPTIKFRSI